MTLKGRESIDGLGYTGLNGEESPSVLADLTIRSIVNDCQRER